MTKWYKAILTKSVLEADSIKTLYFKTSQKQAHIPGQYCSIRLTTPTGEVVQRDYSLLNAPNKKGDMHFAVKLIENGELSPLLHSLKKGDSVLIKGPLGNHFVLKDNNPIVCISGGVGVAPFISKVQQKLLHKVTILGSFRSYELMPYKTILRKKKRNYRFIYTLTRDQDYETSFHGRIDKNILESTLSKKDMAQSLFYICGSALFVTDMKELLIRTGIPQKKIYIEIFG